LQNSLDAISAAIGAESTFCGIKASLKDLPCSKMAGAVKPNQQA
jgi:hypothetical protein